MSGPPAANVRIALASRPENVALVREAIAGIGASIDLGDAIEEIKAAVSEAANNVVMDAYGDGEGPFEVELSLAANELCAIVRDHGEGIGPRLVGPGDDGRGIGLAVIEALASHMELRTHAGRGLEVAMWFPVPERRSFPGLQAAPSVSGPASGHPGDVALTVAPAALSAPLLGRVLVALAARAGFSIDRLSDVQLIADAISARLAAALDGGAVELAALAEGRRLELVLGPLRDGGSSDLLTGSTIAGIGPVIERLVDSLDVRTAQDGREHLVLRIEDARARG
jgi:anti-sigma regulatory factor (Ser/Thr protein kinase)